MIKWYHSYEIYVVWINNSESRRSSLVEIQEESEEDSSNTDNSKDCIGSTGFDLHKIPDVTSYNDGNTRNPISKESNKADGIATNVSQKGEDEPKPKSILKNSEKLRRGSTP